MSILPTFYSKLLWAPIPKAEKIQLSHKYIFTLSGSASVKAVRRTLMKFSPVFGEEVNIGCKKAIKDVIHRGKCIGLF